ncbi:MAG TPA: NAD(P)/FAD-dependent oxidoreductase [Streptosporangiaceae bacterium]
MGPILIVGGGVGGAGCALALHRAGYDVTVYEARPEPEETPPRAGPRPALWWGDDLGAFLTLASNGMRALGAAGAAEAAAAAGFELTEMRVLAESGERIAAIPLSGHADPLTRFRCVRRAELCAVLRQEAERRGVAVHYGARLTAVEEDADGVTARFADGRTARGALLIGADGLNSATRTLIDPGTAAPRYAGQRVFYGYTTAVTPPPEPLPRITMVRGGAAFGFAVSPGGETYWFARVTGPELPAAELAAAPVQQWRTDLVELLRADATPAADIVATTGDLMATNARDLPDVPRWSTARTLVIGDAAHAASPATGQGASMALEDAVVLAKALRDEATTAAALEAYERVRRPRVSHNIANSARLTGARRGGPTTDVERRAAAEHPPPPPGEEDPGIVRLLDWTAPLP